MTEIGIPLPDDASRRPVERLIESACAACGLRPALKGTLKRFPGSVRWHYRPADSPGTLEVTYWPAARRAWLSLRPGRSTLAVQASVGPLREALRRLLWARDVEREEEEKGGGASE